MGSKIMKMLGRLGAWIDRISERVGKGASWLTAALMVSIGYEVIMRYGFRAPTLWSFDMSYMIGGSLYVLGFAWVLRDDGNVRVDILSSRLPKKVQLYIHLVLTLLLFFPMAFMLCHISLKRTIHSWNILEKASYTIWYPPIYPLRTVVSFALLIWLFQGIVTFYRNIQKLSGDKT
jgi:TRAP-type mannitol/chloroaromatic compound transport system permease small subunit